MKRPESFRTFFCLLVLKILVIARIRTFTLKNTHTKPYSMTLWTTHFLWFTIQIPIFLSTLLGSSQPYQSSDFVHADGKKLIDSTGTEILLKGVSFGNDVWNKKEIPDSHHEEIDFERVRAMNMNAVRFYINYKTLEDDNKPHTYKNSGWQWLDKNIAWARKYGVYLILNMHVPPGGFQSNGKGTALWKSKKNQKRLALLWKAIAERYKDEPVIAGYDLLNEPYVTKSYEQWTLLAKYIAKNIRTVDKNHLLIVEKPLATHGPDSNNGYNNMFLINDTNTMYTFHFYDPIEYTHQFASWSNFGEGGGYPDSDNVVVSGKWKWYTATLENPVLPTGTTDWTYLEGKKYKVENEDIHLGTLALVGSGIKNSVYFDDLEIIEYDETGTYVRTVAEINPVADDYYYFWSEKEGDGKGAFTSSVGHNDRSSIVIRGTKGDANVNVRKVMFRAKQGYSYQANGWVKGDDLPEEAKALIRVDFYNVDGKILGRNKEYLKYLLQPYLKFRDDYNVPIYLGEYGVIRTCFDNRGGLEWVRDMVDLSLEHKIHSTYHAYHEDHFGIYYGYGEKINPEKKRTELIELFTQKFEP